MAQENFDYEQLHTKLQALERKVQELEQPQRTVVLTWPDGKFKVELAVVGLQRTWETAWAGVSGARLVATPMLWNEKTRSWNRAEQQSRDVARWRIYNENVQNIP